MPKNIGQKILNFLNAALVKMASAIEQIFDVLVDMGSTYLRAFIIKTVDNEHIEDILIDGLDDAVEVAKDLDITIMIESAAGGVDLSAPMLIGEGLVEISIE
jgi:hypothetical protein